jgi:MYXO-CTERM domain-containing protein
MSGSFGRSLTCAVHAAVLSVAFMPLLASAAIIETDDDGSTVEISGIPGPNAETTVANFDKLDGFLVEVLQNAPPASGAASLQALRALSPLASFSLYAPSNMPSIRVEVSASGDPGALRTSLEQLGFQNASVFANHLSGYLPVDQIGQAAALPGLRFMRASLARTRAGAVTTQGDFAQNSYLLRGTPLQPKLTGKGVTVGILSDSFDCLDGYKDDKKTGDLPLKVQVIEEDSDCSTATDEGRGMAQIVYDVAPGADLAFYTAFNGEADFANGIVALANAGAKVIVDDVLFFDEPVFQDGLVAQAVDQVKAQGVAYFSAAGNEGRDSYEAAPFRDSGLIGGPLNRDRLMNFDSTGKSVATFLPFTIPAQSGVVISLHWDQPYALGGNAGSKSSLDLCVTDGTGQEIICKGDNALNGDPVQYIGFNNWMKNDKTYGIEVGLRTFVNRSTPVPGRVKLIFFGTTPAALRTNSPTLHGHANAAGAIAVGASFYLNTPNCGISPAVVNSYSSAGGDPILFDAAGSRIGLPGARRKPDLVAPDGGNTTFFGFDFHAEVPTGLPAQCADVPTPGLGNQYYPGFFGTSAAAPHAAGVAALLLNADPNLTPDRIRQLLTSTARDMGKPGFDFDTGAGFIDANGAYTVLATGTASGSNSSGGDAGAWGLGELMVLGAAALARRRRRH